MKIYIYIIFLLTLIFSVSAYGMIIGQSDNTIRKTINDNNSVYIVLNNSNFSYMNYQSREPADISYDGKNIVFLSSTLYKEIWYSQDYGNTWYSRNISLSYPSTTYGIQDLILSTYGDKQIYGRSVVPYAISTDFFSTYTYYSGVVDALNVICANKNTFQYMIYLNSFTGKVLKSSDYGATFSILDNIYNPTLSASRGCAISDDGQHQYYVDGYTRVHNSSNYGSSWSALDVSMTGDNYDNMFTIPGTNTVLMSAKVTDAYHKISFNNGINWSDMNISIGSATAINKFSSNQNGSIILASAGNLIFLSRDYGLSWNKIYTCSSASCVALYTPEINTSTQQNYTLGNQIYNINQCVDNYNICNNTFVTTPYNEQTGQYTFYCMDVLDISYCPTGCIETSTLLNSGYTYNIGACNTTISCTNDVGCSVINQTKCYDATQIQTCSLGTDGCLHLGTPYSVPIGYLCYQDSLISSALVNPQQITYPGFTLNMWSVNDVYTTYSNNFNTRTITANTEYSSHYQRASITQDNNAITTYTAKQCYYSDTLTYTATNNLAIENTLNTLNTVSTADNQYYNMRYYLDTDSNPVHIYTNITSQTDITAIDLHLIRNTTDKSLCLYSNTSLVMCAYSLSGSDDLTSTLIELNTFWTQKTFSIKMTTNYSASPTQILYSGWMNFVNTNISELSKIKYTGTNGSVNSLINSIQIRTIPTYPAFSTTLKNDYNYITCTYSTLGCKLLRVYNVNNLSQPYQNYKDYTICLNSVGGTSVQDTTPPSTDFTSGYGLSDSTKYVVVIITLIVLITGFTIMGYSMGNGNLGMIIGVTFGFFALIFFSVFGWIPIWVLVLLVIFILVIMTFKIFMGKGNSEVG